MDIDTSSKDINVIDSILNEDDNFADNMILSKTSVADTPLYQTTLEKLILDKKVGNLASRCFYTVTPPEDGNNANPTFFALNVGHEGQLKVVGSQAKEIINLNIAMPITMEAIDDILAAGGSLDDLAKACRYVADWNENKEFFKFLDSEAKQVEPFKYKKEWTPLDVREAILSKIQDEVIHMNLMSFKGLDAFCIISPKHIHKLGWWLDPVDDWVTLGTYKNITFVVNPLFEDDKVYVGLKGKDMHSSSFAYVPITFKLFKAHAVDTGDAIFRVLDRFSYIKNPLYPAEHVLAVFDIVEE